MCLSFKNSGLSGSAAHRWNEPVCSMLERLRAQLFFVATIESELFFVDLQA
jgi:hypothetical protein